MMRTLSAHDVLALLLDGQEICDVIVEEPVLLRHLDAVPHRGIVRFRNCRLDHVDISFSTFEAPITFEDCSIRSIFAMSTFFIGGFSAQRCDFAKRTAWSCGGHNKNGASFTLSDCTFVEFVDFEDEWFMGPVRVALPVPSWV